MFLFLQYFSRGFYFNRVNIYSYYSELYVYRISFLLDLLYFFFYHSNSQLKFLSDIAVTDCLRHTKRFLVTYIFFSPLFITRMHILLFISSNFLELSSICRLYSSANWLERENWEMFGIFFYKHPDLRRLLTDYGFSGHPLRKDFPLSGYFEFFYSDRLKRITKFRIILVQEFRFFEFDSPWVSS